jgi:Ribbon-helix-helix protein, copG family.
MRMRIVTVKLPELYIESIDDLIRAGRYASRSDAIRAAVRELLKRELWSSRPYPVRGSRRGKDLKVEVVEIE